MKNFNFQILVELDLLGCPKHDLTMCVCLSACTYIYVYTQTAVTDDVF